MEKLEKWQEMKLALSNAWVLAYQLEKETDGEIKKVFSDLQSKINNIEVESYKARDLLIEKSL